MRLGEVRGCSVVEWLYLGLALLMIVGTGYFVAGEFSLLTLDRHDVDKALAEGQRGAKYLDLGLKHLSTQLSAAQVGITLTTLLTGYLMEPSVGVLLRRLFGAFDLPAAASQSLSLFIALMISTFLSMVIGELVPKNMAISAPMAAAKIAVPFQYFFSVVFKPVIAFLNGSANKALLSMGIEPQEESSAGRSADELTALVRHSADEGAIDEQTADLVARTLSFSELTAEDIMTPRTRMVSVNKDSTAADIIAQARSTGFSRFPVAGDSRDDIVGIVHVKHAIAVPFSKREDAYAGGLMSELREVPDTLELEPLLLLLRQEGNQVAVVIDEYGGTAGLVTLEDVVEELVGEVADEHDRLRVMVRPARDGSWIVPGMMRPDEVVEATGMEIPSNSDYETMAGLVLYRLGEIPKVGARISIDGADLVVERMMGHRIERLRMIPDYSKAAL